MSLSAPPLSVVAAVVAGEHEDVVSAQTVDGQTGDLAVVHRRDSRFPNGAAVMEIVSLFRPGMTAGNHGSPATIERDRRAQQRLTVNCRYPRPAIQAMGERCGIDGKGVVTAARRFAVNGELFASDGELSLLARPPLRTMVAALP